MEDGTKCGMSALVVSLRAGVVYDPLPALCLSFGLFCVPPLQIKTDLTVGIIVFRDFIQRYLQNQYLWVKKLGRQALRWRRNKL